MRNLTVFGFTFLAACAPGEQAPEGNLLDGYSVIGDLPADVDVEQEVAEMGDAEYRVIGNDETGEVAVIVRDGSPLARNADNDFSLVGPVVCTDCGGACTNGVSTRTLQFDMNHDSGWSSEEFTTIRTGSGNFTNVTSNPSTKWSVPLGGVQTLEFTGTIGNCLTTFSYDFQIRGEQRIFVTSTTHTGNLGGLAGADGICQTRASAAGLTGTWEAWLSTAASPASTRINQYAEAYVLPNGSTIANNYADLVDAAIQRRIDRNESNVAVAASNVWTGTNTAGAASATNCVNWTSGVGGQTGMRGRTDRTNGGWTNYTAGQCNSASRLYCVEQ